MGHMDNCFEEYGVLRYCHLRRRDTRSVKLMYPLPSPRIRKYGIVGLSSHTTRACGLLRGPDILLG